MFLAAQPGLEDALAEEARAAGFDAPSVVPGGVETRGDFIEMMRANLELAGAGRVLIRIAEFRAFHLAQLDKRARKVPWSTWLPGGCPLKVEATCRKSKIYHNRAAAQRVARAAEAAGAVLSQDESAVRVVARIEDDLVTISLDSSGAPLHRRGSKTFVGKAPLRETMAALFLRQMRYAGSMPLVDPMCGSGTILLEAASFSAGLPAGRARAFAFERFTGFEASAFKRLLQKPRSHADQPHLFGFDRDQGAIYGAQANAERAGVAAFCEFACQPVSALMPPKGPPGLVLTNPPYGARIGNKKLLFGLYGALGQVLGSRFAGWRVGVITSEGGLAKATGLPLSAGPRVAHGGLSVQLWQTGPLP